MKSSGQLMVDLFAKGEIDLKSKVENALPPGLDFKGNLQLTEGTLKYPKLPVPIKGIEVNATIDPKQLVINSFKAATDKSKVSASGDVADYLNTKRTNFKAVC